MRACSSGKTGDAAIDSSESLKAAAVKWSARTAPLHPPSPFHSSPPPIPLPLSSFAFSFVLSFHSFFYLFSFLSPAFPFSFTSFSSPPLPLSSPPSLTFLLSLIILILLLSSLHSSFDSYACICTPDGTPPDCQPRLTPFLSIGSGCVCVCDTWDLICVCVTSDPVLLVFRSIVSLPVRLPFRVYMLV